MAKSKKKKSVSGTKTIGPVNISKSRPAFKDVTISLCMMVRNEEKNLPRLFDSIKKMDIADEIRVFDTGSTDDTVGICKRYGAKMIEAADVSEYFEDTEFGPKINFSKARNKSMEGAAGDWLLLLDADEELSGSANGLRAFLKKCQLEVEAICLKFVDMQDERQCMIFPPPRIFRKGKIYFANIVHNSPRGFREPAILFPGLEVRHYGFDHKKNPEMEKEKFERTLGLLKKRLEINPLDFQAYFYLAQIYGSVKDFDRAIEYSIKYIRNKAQVARFNPSIYFSLVQACMAKNEPKMADKWLAESMRELPKDIDICMALLDYGVWQNKPHVVTAAAEKFIIGFESMLANPLSMGSRFVFNFNDHSLVKVLFHLSMTRLSQGVNCMQKLVETLGKIEDDQAELVKDDIRRETQKLNKLDFIKFVEEMV